MLGHEDDGLRRHVGSPSDDYESPASSLPIASSDDLSVDVDDCRESSSREDTSSVTAIRRDWSALDLPPSSPPPPSSPFMVAADYVGPEGACGHSRTTPLETGNNAACIWSPRLIREKSEGTYQEPLSSDGFDWLDTSDFFSDMSYNQVGTPSLAMVSTNEALQNGLQYEDLAEAWNFMFDVMATGSEQLPDSASSLSNGDAHAAAEQLVEHEALRGTDLATTAAADFEELLKGCLV